MITTEDSMIMENGQYKKAERFFGLHDDAKPSGVGNASKFTEIDTGKTFLYDAVGDDWYEYSEGGGGGGSGGGVLVVHVDAQTGALDKTWQEIADAEYAVVVQSVGTTTAYLYIANIQKTGDTSYVVNAFMIIGTTIYESNYIATSAEGYPVFNQG